MVDFSAFDLSHSNGLTCHEGQLVPVLCREVYPNDTFKWSADAFLRFMPMVAPMMTDVNVRLHAWFVPNRLIFDGWEDFITGGKDGIDSQLWPYVTAPSGGFAVGSLADYLGYPTGVAGIEVSALPFRAYDLIYNTWYRDENLVSELTISKAAGSDTTTSLDLKRCAWNKHGLTGLLPFAQRGPKTYLPLGIEAPVIGDGNGLGLTNGTLNFDLYGRSDKDMAMLHKNTGSAGVPIGTDYGSSTVNAGSNGVIGVSTDKAMSGMKVDLEEASSVSVDDFNIAIQVQRFLQKNAFGGARYIESILNHFGKRSSDSRLQRPEFLGGGKCRLDVSEVLQTSSTDSTSPQGNMSGRGVAYMNSPHFLRNFEEHGWIIVLMSIMPKASYSQGLEHQFMRKTRLEYCWPVFAKLGPQAKKNVEVYAQAPTVVDSDGNPVNDGTFGYEPRYEELRHIDSTFHGQFKSTLAYWHQGRVFANLPQLNEQFITCNPDKRIFAVTDANEDECIVKIDHNIEAIRPFPKNGYPGPIGYMG